MPESPSIRAEYQRQGVQSFYQQQGAQYRNPHEDAIRLVLRQAVTRWKLDPTSATLDLACGSGEATLLLRELGFRQIDGIDPYTGAAYQERTGQQTEAYTFEQIAAGALAERAYDLVVCCFALHLAAESRLPTLAYQLSQIAPLLLILTPHKRPHLKAEWGWSLDDEFVSERVRCRLYRRGFAKFRNP